MHTTIHSFKKSNKIRSNSQNNTQQVQKNTFKKLVHQRHKRYSFGRIQTEKQMNILVNGKRINQISSPNAKKTNLQIICSNQNLQQRPSFKSPKKLSNLKQYIYKKYLTQFDEEINPHIEGIIKLRQIFNQKIKTRQTQYPFHQTSSGFNQRNSQLSKIINIRNPDIYAMTYMKKNSRFSQRPERFWTDRKYNNIHFKQVSTSKNSHETNQKMADKSNCFDINPWEVD